MSNGWHLAQVNIGRLVAPHGDSRVQPFFDALDEVNALAESSPGFVWRLKGEGNSATDLKPTADPLLIPNMSVWEDADSLFQFVYRSAHTPFMVRRREFFEKFEGSYQALWWIEAGTTPTINDALSRLRHLDRFGPTAHAFTFKKRFPPPGASDGPVDMKREPYCVGWA